MHIFCHLRAQIAVGNRCAFRHQGGSEFPRPCSKFHRRLLAAAVQTLPPQASAAQLGTSSASSEALAGSGAFRRAARAYPARPPMYTRDCTWPPIYSSSLDALAEHRVATRRHARCLRRAVAGLALSGPAVRPISPLHLAASSAAAFLPTCRALGSWLPRSSLCCPLHLCCLIT
jgi:hypothetical protein